MTSLAIVDMSDADGGWGTISYNGYTFGPFRNFSLTGTPIEDDAGRISTCTEYLLDVVGIVATPNNVSGSSTTMDSLRTRLLQPGQALTLINLGIGDIKINTGSGDTDSDISWGPHPKSVSVTNIGGCTAFEVRWQCAFRIKECTSVPTGTLAAYNYSVTYRIDEAGLTSRVVEGYLQVPQSRITGLGAQLSADSQRSTYVNVVVPAGFRRTDQFYRLSADRTREDFVIADTQLPAVGESPPPGCVNADVDYEMSNEPPGFSRWTAKLSGELETAADVPPARAAAAFILIVLDRWQIIQNTAQQQNGVAIPTRMSFGRKMFTRKSRFSMEWSVVSCLSDLLQQGGIWTPVQSWDVATWSASMQAAWSQRGQANLVYNSANDALLDLCTLSTVAPVNDGSYLQISSGASSQPFSCGNIQQEYSWLAYSNRLVAQNSRNFTLHKIAAGYTPPTQNPTNPSDANTNLGAQPSGDYSDVIQDKSGPTQYVLMVGKGLRVQYKPSVPNLITVGGQPVEEVDRIIDGPKLAGCIFGCPVYSVRWAIIYKPKSGYFYDLKSDAEKNPTLCCTATS